MNATVTLPLEEFDKLKEQARNSEHWTAIIGAITNFVVDHNIPMESMGGPPYVIVYDLFAYVKKLEQQ